MASIMLPFFSMPDTVAEEEASRDGVVNYEGHIDSKSIDSSFMDKQSDGEVRQISEPVFIRNTGMSHF